MDSSYNPAHHIQVGRLVHLMHLSRAEFNNQVGLVMGFHHAKARFAVQLVNGDGTPKLFKGKNLSGSITNSILLRQCHVFKAKIFLNY